jgi:hypothetical protein
MPGPAGPGAAAARAPAAPVAARPPAPGEPAAGPRLEGQGQAAASANAASLGAADASQPQADGDQAAALAGRAFDQSGAIQARAEGPRAVSAAELLHGRRLGLMLGKLGDTERLTRLAKDVAAKRALRAARGEGALSKEDAAVLRGIDELAAAVAMGHSTPAQLAEAARVVETMDIGKLRKFSALAARFIDTEVPGKSTPFARVGNVEHVNQQLIDPLAEDGPHLAKAFKTNPSETDEHFVEMIRALQYATDTGKQHNPDAMAAALARFNPQLETGPNWYVNNFILPHEYASMRWLDILGAEADFTAAEAEAFKRLIANHNFGPDLTDPRNAAMRDHWWPKNFREQTLPMLAAMGIDVEKYFSRDEHGVLQYNNAQGHRYQLLLAAYDRAIAVKANGYGLATWKKYGTQDFNGKKSRLKAIRESNAKKGPGEPLTPDPEGAKDEAGVPGPIFEFDGPSVIRAMEFAAETAEQHIESLWAALFKELPPEVAKRDFPLGAGWRSYPPFYAQRKAIGRLNGLLRVTKDSNPEGMTNRADVLPQAGVAYYQAESPQLAGIYRVVLQRVGKGAFDPVSTDYEYQARIDKYENGAWRRHERALAQAGLADHGNDPVALYIDLIRRDKGW